MYKYPQEYPSTRISNSIMSETLWLNQKTKLQSIMVIHPTQLGEKLTEESTHILNCN